MLPVLDAASFTLGESSWRRLVLYTAAQREVRFKHSLRPGYMEDTFLRDLTGDRETDPYSDVEPLGDGATRVLAWHLSWQGV